MPNNWSKSCRYKSAESMLTQKRLLMSQKIQIITNRLLDNKESSKFKLIGEVFYGANYWSPIITSKYSSEILSNHNKHLCFFCFQDKMWIKMPKWCNFLISSEEFILITKNFWRIFWRDHWWSIISTIENFRYCCIK